MTTVAIHEAQATLADLIHRLVPGEELVITENGEPVAVVTRPPRPSEPGAAKEERKLGTQRGSVLYMAPDFDAPLDDFKEYME